MFEKLDKTPAYKVVADALQKAIISRQLETGDALPTEGNLAEQFGVNRSTLREGIRHLEQMGFVERQGKKLIVTRPSHDQIGDHMSKALMLHNVTFKELWDVKMALEPLAAGLAATSIDPERLDLLEENVAQMAQAIKVGDSQKVVALDVEFHKLISDAADNSALTMAREAIALLFYPSYKASMLTDVAEERLLKAHRMILDAIKAKDAETAGDWMRKHIIDFRRGYEMAGLDINKPVETDD